MKATSSSCNLDGRLLAGQTAVCRVSALECGCSMMLFVLSRGVAFAVGPRYGTLNLRSVIMITLYKVRILRSPALLRPVCPSICLPVESEQ